MEDKNILEKAALLIEVPRTKFVPLEGDKGVVIRAVTPWELGKIWSEYKNDEFTQTLKVIELALEKPKLTFEELKALKWKYLTIIIGAVLEHSGLTLEEIEKARGAMSGLKPAEETKEEATKPFRAG